MEAVDSKEEKIIKINMFGGFSIKYGDIPFTFWAGLSFPVYPIISNPIIKPGEWDCKGCAFGKFIRYAGRGKSEQ